ncbi:alpha/beta hydrolase [Pseudonocardia dioxanivorans]|uniref:alpha/beta hydrolase n=1 Tax=Pseudonocardia dioxanivorans TaxID=240495 RepID=UPI000CD3058F|nr:alpha/beta hydrolase [Pseudonocardia dioxanivorans]
MERRCGAAGEVGRWHAGAVTFPAPSRALRTTLVVLAALLTAALTTACTTTASGTGAAQGAAAGSDPALAKYYDQTLSWGPCAPFAESDADRKAFAAPDLDCARLQVPLDYAQPGGRTAEIAVLRHRATDQAARIGSLLVNPGGPGGSGISFAATLAGGAGTPRAILSRFDLVGFDPRGVGASTPAIDCLDDKQNDAERADDDTDPSSAGVARTEAENKAFVQGCVSKTGVDVLANVGTRDVVKDMDVLRAVLGDDKLTYAGFSYGTRIGSTYAEAFPQNVRALVLDGALDPEQTTIDRTVDQNEGFQDAFDAFARWCAAQPTPCPLGEDPAQATAAFQKLVRPLIDKPVPAGGGRVLGWNDAQTGVSQALYISAAYPILARGIAELALGSGSILLRLADLYYDRDASGHYSNMLEAFTAISCVDEQQITDRAQIDEQNRRVDEVAPFRSTGLGPVDALDPCAFWPVKPTSQPHVPHVSGLPPTVVVSVTGDPATPYEAGVDLAKALGGRLIKVDGNQHTASLQGNACVDGAVAAYLTDLTLPPDGLECRLS